MSFVRTSVSSRDKGCFSCIHYKCSIIKDLPDNVITADHGKSCTMFSPKDVVNDDFEFNSKNKM